MSNISLLAGRFILAIMLMIGFYFLALAIAGLLLYVPYAEWAFGHRIHPKIALFCIGGAIAILWSVMPRPDRFSPPGPPLYRKDHPLLYKAVEDIARETQQTLPAEIYLIPNVNAWVCQRGGIMGIGSRRVMGLGLPLLQALTVSQLRAVLAHEFGHFCGGDTVLGPWIYKTRDAIGRTLRELANRGQWLSKPFEWYGIAFFRITHAISRHQELIADRLAAKVAGARALGDGLKRLHGTDFAFASYWRAEMSPAVDRGYRPPLTQGFQQFLSSSLVSEQVEAAIQREVNERKSNPYDTHPPLSERLAALSGMSQGDGCDVDLPAITLLEGVAELEGKLFHFLTSSDLKPIGWEDVPEKVFLPAWTELARDQARYLHGITPATLPMLATSDKSLAVRLKLAETEENTSMEDEARAAEIIGGILCILFHSKGWRIDAPPGASVFLHKDAISFCPFRVIQHLKSGILSPEEWTERCNSAGVADIDFGEFKIEA